MIIKSAAIQFNITEGNSDYNMQKAEELIKAAAADKAELIMLPEMWNSGFDFNHLVDYAQDFNGEVITILRGLARDLGVFLVGGSFAEIKNDKFYNTCPVINQEGNVIAKYRKVHLFSHVIKEHLYLSPGNEWVLCEYEKDNENVILGLNICYDLRFPEFARNLALRGARLLTAPAGWPSTRIKEYQTLCQARAIENRSFLVTTNYTDTNKTEYCGNSMLISPFGEIIAKLENEEGYAIGDIDLSILSDTATFNSIADRRSVLDEIDDSQL